MAKKKKTVAQRETERIKRQIRNLEKRGYVVYVELPKTTKALKNLTLEKLYKKSKYIDKETGELISAKRGRELERQKAAKKGAYTRKIRKQTKQKDYAPHLEDIVLDNLVMLINKLEYADTSWGKGRKGAYHRKAEDITEAETARQALLSLLKNEISKTDSLTVAKRIEQKSNWYEINDLVEAMLYGYKEQIHASYSKLASIITEGMLSLEDTRYFSEADASLEDGYE